MATVEAEKFTRAPQYKLKFKPTVAKEIIKSVLTERLAGKQYSTDDTAKWTKDIATAIKQKLKALNLPRYKFLVQVVIGEQKGAGVRMGCRCFWDDQTDSVASETYVNESLFCAVSAFGVYLY